MLLNQARHLAAVGFIYLTKLLSINAPGPKWEKKKANLAKTGYTFIWIIIYFRA